MKKEGKKAFPHSLVNPYHALPWASFWSWSGFHILRKDKVILKFHSGCDEKGPRWMGFPLIPCQRSLGAVPGEKNLTSLPSFPAWQTNQHFTLSVNMRESKVTVQLLLCEKSALLVLFFKGVLICKQLCLERKSIWMPYCAAWFCPHSQRGPLPSFFFFSPWTWKTLSHFPSADSSLIQPLQTFLRHEDGCVQTERNSTYSPNPVAWANQEESLSLPFHPLPLRQPTGKRDAGPGVFAILIIGFGPNSLPNKKTGAAAEAWGVFSLQWTSVKILFLVRAKGKGSGWWRLSVLPGSWLTVRILMSTWRLSVGENKAVNLQLQSLANFFLSFFLPPSGWQHTEYIALNRYYTMGLPLNGFLMWHLLAF